MSNQNFWTSIQRIIDDGFSSEGLELLELYADKFITERLIYKRFSPFEQHGCSEGGALHVIASLLAGAEVRADKLTAPEGSFEREQQQAAEQASRIEKWARQYNCWFDSIDEKPSRVFLVSRLQKAVRLMSMIMATW